MFRLLFLFLFVVPDFEIEFDGLPTSPATKVFSSAGRMLMSGRSRPCSPIHANDAENNPDTRRVLTTPIAVRWLVNSILGGSVDQYT